MPSPLSHSIVSLSFFPLLKSENKTKNKIFALVLIFTALLPDMDILTGIFTGNFLKYHRIYTHTILGTTIYSIIVLILISFLKVKNKMLIFISLTLAYISHIVLDLLGIDNYPPNGTGIKIFYPFSDFSLNPQFKLFYFEIVGKNNLNPNIFSIENLFFFIAELITSLIIGFIIYQMSKYYIKRRYSKRGFE